jgi:hypothetical protein
MKSRPLEYVPPMAIAGSALLRTRNARSGFKSSLPVVSGKDDLPVMIRTTVEAIRKVSNHNFTHMLLREHCGALVLSNTEHAMDFLQDTLGGMSEGLTMLGMAVTSGTAYYIHSYGVMPVPEHFKAIVDVSRKEITKLTNLNTYTEKILDTLISAGGSPFKWTFSEAGGKFSANCAANEFITDLLNRLAAEVFYPNVDAKSLIQIDIEQIADDLERILEETVLIAFDDPRVAVALLDSLLNSIAHFVEHPEYREVFSCPAKTTGIIHDWMLYVCEPLQEWYAGEYERHSNKNI